MEIAPDLSLNPCIRPRMGIKARSHVNILALVAATLGALACLWTAWCEFPFYAWNDVRLAPAFAVRHGINPYPGLGEGPLFTWIYGPIGTFINLPATFAPTANSALHTASVINALTVLGPLALIFFSSAQLRSRGLAACGLAIALATLLVPKPTLALQVADHSAIALGLLSCWCIARVPRPRGIRLVAAAACCALAVWSKQITLLLLPAQVVYFMISGQRATVVRYVGWVALFGVAALGAFIALFGFDNLWLNLVDIPGRLPWAEFWPRFNMRPWLLVTQLLIPAILLLTVWRTGHWPNRQSEHGRFFQLTVLAAVAMLPIGLLAFFKIGGDTNLLHSSHYLLPAFLLTWLVRDRSTTAAATMRLLAVLTVALGARAPDLGSLPTRAYTQHIDTAAVLTSAYPQALWFPQHPVFTFYADGRLWHSEDGVLTRNVAGYGLTQEDFRRHLPPKLKGVVYPAIVDFPFAMPLLTEFNRTFKVPYWKVHTRDAP